MIWKVLVRLRLEVLRRHGCTGVMYVGSGASPLNGNVIVSMMVVVEVTKTIGEVISPVQAACSELKVTEGTIAVGTSGVEALA